jgi:Subtilisin-like serine proteases
MRNIILRNVLCILLCYFSLGTGFSQLSTPPISGICNDYHPNQLIIEIDKSPPSGNIVTGTAAFTDFGGIPVDFLSEGNTFDLYLVEFDFNLPKSFFKSIEDAQAFYECGEGIIESVSGIKRVRIRGSDFNYTLSIDDPNLSNLGTEYDLQNYIPYDNCLESYLGLPSIPTCNNITVAAVDSGCEVGTPFDGQVLFGEGYDFVDNDPFAYDENGHGTRVLSVVAGETNNNASAINYIPVRVLDDEGEGDLWTFFKGLNFAIDQAEIIVVSLEATICEEDLCIRVYDLFLDKAASENRLIVGAAGNSQLSIDPGGNYFIPGSGQGENLIVVGGSSCFQNPADFSNYGSINVDLFAPSEQISVYPPALATGTSFAAPQIASVAAIAGLTSPAFNPTNIKSFIMDNVIDRDWNQYCVTGGTFNYDTDFDSSCSADLRNKESKEKILLPDVSMNTYFSENNLAVSIKSSIEQNANLQIIHLSGAVLAEEDILLTSGNNENHIDIPPLPTGIYLVSLKAENGIHLLKKALKNN